MGHKTAVSRPLPASTLLLDRSTPRVNLIQGRRVFLGLRCISYTFANSKIRYTFLNCREIEMWLRRDDVSKLFMIWQMDLKNMAWDTHLGSAHFSGSSREDRSVPDFIQPHLLLASVRRLVSPHLAFRDPYYTSRLNFIRGMSHHSHEYQH